MALPFLPNSFVTALAKLAQSTFSNPTVFIAYCIFIVSPTPTPVSGCEANFDKSNLSPDAATMQEMKELYGGQTTFIGHIDPGYLMVADEEGLRKQCREMIDAYKKDGGFVLATGCEYPAGLDDKFARIMVEEAKNYGKYYNNSTLCKM